MTTVVERPTTPDAPAGRAPDPRRVASPRRDRRIPLGERSLGSLILLGLSAGLFALIMTIGVVAVGIPAVTGSTPMTILTGSMAPSYPAGTLVIVRPTPVEEIRLGDALTYQLRSGEPELVTHRVVAIGSANGEKRFTTQGDANAIADPNPVREVQIRGTVWYSIPYLGWVNTLVNGEQRDIVVTVIALTLFGYAGYSIARGAAATARRRRARGADSASAMGGRAGRN